MPDRDLRVDVIKEKLEEPVAKSQKLGGNTRSLGRRSRSRIEDLEEQKRN